MRLFLTHQKKSWSELILISARWFPKEIMRGFHSGYNKNHSIVYVAVAKSISFSNHGLGCLSSINEDLLKVHFAFVLNSRFFFYFAHYFLSNLATFSDLNGMDWNVVLCKISQTSLNLYHGFKLGNAVVSKCHQSNAEKNGWCRTRSEALIWKIQYWRPEPRVLNKLWTINRCRPLAR